MDNQLLVSYQEKSGVMHLSSYKKIKWQAFLSLLVCLGFVTYVICQTAWFQKKVFYPYPYREIVREYASEKNLDHALVAGVILSESKFNFSARSHKGAMGLMQLMPETAKWIAQQIEDEDFTLAELEDPEINIRFGTWYLASLHREFDGNEVLMLAAYNAGRGNVKEWMEKYHWDMSFQDIEQIPFKETREYVAKVLKSKSKYQSLYKE